MNIAIETGSDFYTLRKGLGSLSRKARKEIKKARKGESFGDYYLYSATFLFALYDTYHLLFPVLFSQALPPFLCYEELFA